MRPLLYKIFIVVGLILAGPSAIAQSQCLDLFTSPKNTLHEAQELSHTVARQTETLLESAQIMGRSKRGYAVLVGAMVGSAALTTFLGSRLPPELQFTSIFLAQVSTLGVYVLGAPIWEPISSRFRQWAFGVGKAKPSSEPSFDQLESTWIRTQENYSLNSQMSRNVISQFILTVRDNFYAAYRAHNESNPVYSADQVAEAAYRMRILFKEVHPNDPSVKAVVQSTFTNHIKVDSEFKDLVWSRLERLDKHIDKDEVSLYYSRVLIYWLDE